jgi:hypothetical protein
MSSFTLGLDLASVSDASVLVVDERFDVPDLSAVKYGQLGTSACVEHHVVDGIYRWPPGTSYVQTIGDLCSIVAERGFAEEPHHAELYVDKTGPGIPVMEMLTAAYRQGRLALRPLGVTITASRKDNGTFSVGKGNLVTHLVRLVQERRLHVPAQPGADQLRREMGSFTQRYTARGASTYEAATESVHDDSVIALALAAPARDRAPSCRRLLSPAQVPA